jgi:hypothetical protein
MNARSVLFFNDSSFNCFQLFSVDSLGTVILVDPAVFNFSHCRCSQGFVGMLPSYPCSLCVTHDVFNQFEWFVISMQRFLI